MNIIMNKTSKAAPTTSANFLKLFPPAITLREDKLKCLENEILSQLHFAESKIGKINNDRTFDTNNL